MSSGGLGEESAATPEGSNEQAGGGGRGIFGWGHAAVAGVAGGARNAGGWAHQKASNVKNADYSEMGMAFKGYADGNVKALKDVGIGVHDKIGTAYEKKKLDAERKLFELSVPLRAKVIGALKDVVKSGAVGDPDMCDCVKSRLGDLVDLFFEDLATVLEESFENSKAQIGDKSIVKGWEGFATVGEAEKPCVCSPRWWRAQFLYHLVPYDLSIFGNLRDPWFLVEMVFMCLANFSFLPEPYNRIPVRVPYFIMYLFLIWVGELDEYQLVLFIMSVKGLQAISSGVILMCVAACQYFLCVHPGNGTHTCDKSGPGATIPLEISIVDWIGISALVWAAFLMLPYSTRTAGVRDPFTLGAELQEAADEEGGQSSNQSTEMGASLSRQPSIKSKGVGCCGERDADRGGRLAKWLRYDFICFVLSLALCYFLLHAHEGIDNIVGHTPHSTDAVVHDLRGPAGKAAIFWARVVYALLSLPFVLFWVPGLQGVLTHTRLTGYNRYGRVVPYTMRPAPQPKEEMEAAE